MSTLEEKNAGLRRTKSLLWQVATLGTVMDEKRKAAKELIARSRVRRRAQSAGGRLQGRGSRGDPTQEDESAEQAGSQSSNESSVDPWEVAPHKRPVDIPPKAPKPPGVHPTDRVEVVQDLSDREDEPSDEVQTAALAESLESGQKEDQRGRGRKREREEISGGEGEGEQRN